MKFVKNNKGIAFNVLMAIFGMIALTIAAMNFYVSTRNYEFGELQNNVVSLSIESERLKRFLDTIIEQQISNITINIMNDSSFIEAYLFNHKKIIYTYRGAVILNTKKDEFFNESVLKGIIEGLLNNKLKKYEEDYPFNFFETNFSLQPYTSFIVVRSISSIKNGWLKPLIDTKLNSDVVVSGIFTNGTLTVDKELFKDFLLLNYCLSNGNYKDSLVIFNPRDYKFYIVDYDTAKETFILRLKGDYNLTMDTEGLLKICGLENKVTLKNLGSFYYLSKK